jgi:hypothetical protein
MWVSISFLLTLETIIRNAMKYNFLEKVIG